MPLSSAVANRLWIAAARWLARSLPEIASSSSPMQSGVSHFPPGYCQSADCRLCIAYQALPSVESHLRISHSFIPASIGKLFFRRYAARATWSIEMDTVQLSGATSQIPYQTTQSEYRHNGSHIRLFVGYPTKGDLSIPLLYIGINSRAHTHQQSTVYIFAWHHDQFCTPYAPQYHPHTTPTNYFLEIKKDLRNRKSLILWCPGPELNRYGLFKPTDFKSVVSTNFTTRADVGGEARNRTGAGRYTSCQPFNTGAAFEALPFSPAIAEARIIHKPRMFPKQIL